VRTMSGGLDRRLWAISSVVILGAVMSILDTTIVNVAIDALARGMAFDVTPDGRGLANLTSGQINMSCSYAGQTVGSTSGGNFQLKSVFPIAQDGSFSGSVNFTGEPDTTSDVFTIAGKFTNNTMSASWSEKWSFTYQGYPIDCVTGDQTLTATRTG